MKILAGIDEAGLGPTLGPLATAAAAMAVPASWLPDTPWERLDGAVCRQWRRGETRAMVADSKVAYGAGGMSALELTVGAFSLLASDLALPFLEADDGVTTHPCYSRCLSPFPVHTTPDAIGAAAAAMREAFREAEISTLYLKTALLFEPALNSRFRTGLNKNEALLVETGRRLQGVVEAFPERPILIVVDKQGGRNDYLPLLTSLFPGVWVDELARGGPLSAYRLRRAGGDVEIRFQAKADAVSFATALASLAAKYARERAMAELNRWFADRAPEVKATAGYPQDAKRWLAEIRAVPGWDAFALELLVRER